MMLNIGGKDMHAWLILFTMQLKTSRECWKKLMLTYFNTILLGLSFILLLFVRLYLRYLKLILLYLTEQIPEL